MPTVRQNKTLRWCRGGDRVFVHPGGPVLTLRRGAPEQSPLDRQDETVRAVLRLAGLRSCRHGDRSPSGDLLLLMRRAARAQLDLPSQWPAAYPVLLKVRHRATVL